MFEDYATGMGAAYDEMYEVDAGALRTPYSQLQPSLQRDGDGRAADPGGGAPVQLSRPGRHLRHRRRGARLPARRAPPRHRDGPVGEGRGRRPAAGAHAGEVPRRRVRRRPRAAGRRRPAPGRHHLLALPPRRGRDRAAQRRPRPRQRHRPDPRRPGRVPRARGQRPGAVRGLLRDDQPARDRRGAAGDLRRAPDPPGRRLPAEAAHRTAGRRPRRCHRPQRRRAHPRCLQRRLLRARPARPHDGRRAGRGSRPRVPPRPRDDAYDAGPRAGARDLPPGRRRVHRPGALPQQLAARLLRACSTPPAPATSRSPTQSATASPTTS